MMTQIERDFHSAERNYFTEIEAKFYAEMIQKNFPKKNARYMTVTYGGREYHSVTLYEATHCISHVDLIAILVGCLSAYDKMG